MKILKFWYVACTIFCLYSLNAVVEEHYEVAILARNLSETDPITFFICEKLSSFKLKKTEFSSEELRIELVNHFNRSKYPSLYGEDPNSHKKLVLNRLETGYYLIFNGLLCITLKYKNEGAFMSPIQSQPVSFAFKSSTLDFAQMTSSSDSFDQLTVKRKGPPYSNCSESNSRFRCLNECFKGNFRLSRYFYESNETGLIHLNSSTNQTIEQSEKSCFKKCWRENCKIVQFIPFRGSRKPITTTLEAQPKLNEFDFWVQYIGLVCSFANISLNQFASMAIKFASLRVKRRKVRIGLLCLKWAILFLSLACCVYLYTIMFLANQVEERNPPRKEIARNLINQKIVRLAICVDIRDYFARIIDFNLNCLNKTMSEIEKVTNGALDKYLAGIYLNDQNRMFRLDYVPEPKVLFGKTNGLSRCFILVIRPDYQLMSSNPKLTIKFKEKYGHTLYLLTKNENLNEKTFEYTAKRAFMKRIVKRLEQGRRCVNYLERYTNCTSKWHCVERCINREALEMFKKITLDKTVVVDKEQFSPEEWRTIYSMEFPAQNPGPNHRTYENISSRCLKKFQDELTCVEVQFIETVEIAQTNSPTKEIDLFLDVELSIEEFTWFNLLLGILNIQSIFFGMTVLKLQRMLYGFIKPKSQFLVRMRNDKIAQFLIYLLCSIGFTWHTYRIFDLSINVELSYSPNYEIVNRVRMPMMVFCLPVDEKLIDRNHQLTGNYLEQLTSEIKAESVFRSVTYLNKSNEWTTFSLSLVKRFFFLHLKCFRIMTDQEYDRNQFYFSTDSQALKVLRVNFTNRFQGRNAQTVYFMTKTDETTGFSNVLNLDYENRNARYLAEQSELTVSYKDHLSFIKRFLSISYEDHFDDIDGRLPELKSSEFSFRTLKNPVEKSDFDCELQDGLFEQFFTQIKSETTSDSLENLDYQKKFVVNHLKTVYRLDSDLAFSLDLIKKSQSAKNEDLAKLVLNLLNVLFLWFDLGPLDLHPIFVLFHDYLLVYLYHHLPVYLLNKLTQFLHFSRKWLKKLETPLYELLKPRKQNSPQTLRV